MDQSEIYGSSVKNASVLQLKRPHTTILVMTRLTIKIKKETELNDDAPAGNLVSSIDDINEDDESGSDNLFFTGVWFFQVVDDASTHENIVSISVFDDTAVEGYDVRSMNSYSSLSTTNSNHNTLLHTPVLSIENSQKENSDISTSISDININIC